MLTGLAVKTQLDTQKEAHSVNTKPARQFLLEQLGQLGINLEPICGRRTESFVCHMLSHQSPIPPEPTYRAVLNVPEAEEPGTTLPQDPQPASHKVQVG